MMTKLTSIKGIGEQYANRLREAGISSIEELYLKGVTLQECEEIAERSGISQKLILEWVNRANLFTIKIVGEKDAEWTEVSDYDRPPRRAYEELEQNEAALPGNGGIDNVP
jgi:hypothetical protein